MKVSAQYAQEHFPDLALAAANGEEVEIEVYGQPTLVLLQRRTPVAFERTTPRILGEGIGEMAVPEWDEWKAIDHELEREVNEHPLVPGEL
jgi:antitoxin (DNA-binding transcriptional repressor) of toxin-antitoxin stability system